MTIVARQFTARGSVRENTRNHRLEVKAKFWKKGGNVGMESEKANGMPLCA
jgi:hypothetical protein